MQTIAFLRPSSYHPWGGDLKALLDLQQGMKELGKEVIITSDLSKALSSDLLFFIGTLIDQTAHMHCMDLLQKEYGVIPFHEDYLLYAGASFGFFYFIAKALVQESTGSFSFDLEDLIERPHLIYYFDQMRPLHALNNYSFLKRAKAIIANSSTEEQTLQRDAPGCNTKVVHWAAGHVSELTKLPDDSFLKWTDLQSQNYILQIGRLSSRKNQLATLLATKDLDIPLVFIAMDRANPAYQNLFLEAALRWRRSPVLLITQTPMEGNAKVKVLSTKDRAILPQEMLLSALFHAGLHLHPAFYELPGYTYLESSFFGVPTIASSFGSLKDYFIDPLTKDYLLDDRISYLLPYDLKAIEKEVIKKWGSRYPMNLQIPIYQRTIKDVAYDFLKAIDL